MRSGKSQGITCSVSSPDLLERGRLLLDGELKNLMLPYAGLRVLLYNRRRDYVICRVDSRAGYLTSPALKGFFSAT